MPWMVNGEILTPDRLQLEEVSVRRDMSFQAINDPAQRERSVHTSAQIAAIDVMLVEQVAARDPWPRPGARRLGSDRMDASPAPHRPGNRAATVRERFYARTFRMACAYRCAPVTLGCPPEAR